MAKRTAVIDIGSNSVRIVIYEKTSRYAFHLLREDKSKVRIGEGAYKQGGMLQEAAMQRAFETIEEFVTIAKSYKVRKILCVATSALRDAPNRDVFIKRVSSRLSLNIKVIDGAQEAQLGGIAVANMLPPNNYVTIDIGGGSTELASIQNGMIVEQLSLDLGTVRLKELFCDEGRFDDAVAYIKNAALAIPPSYLNRPIAGIGGTIRAVSMAYMRYIGYPIKVLHGFSYTTKAITLFSKKIYQRPPQELKLLGIKSERFDVIDAGTLIYTTLLEHLQAPEVTVSQVGVREGRFIQDLLRHQRHMRFPTPINPTMQSLIDRYIDDLEYVKNLKRTALELFDLLHEKLQLPVAYRELLGHAATLSNIGVELNYYDFERHSFYLILHSIYGMSHRETLLVATLVRYHTSKEPSEAFIQKYKTLLPKLKEIKGLIYLLALASSMLKANPKTLPFEVTWTGTQLHLHSLAKNHLAIEKLKRLESPIKIIID
ncbi:MAG: hypothetical protein KU37_07910 [Sulfuricurvum sp. PC08-66]|nr:MAG: hypothetical protein KU37_07910 [Sulfuricurvum sp. PC08-66]